MSFLNHYLLYGLPLAALPIIIHLINRQRHRTLPWGAMMFLLDAKRLQRSMAKLRYWLIMAMRVLSILGLIFAISRPLSSGWLGTSVGSQSDTVLLLLDRSPSMEETNANTQQSKRETALAKFSDLFKKTGDGKRFVLIESTRQRPEEILIDQLADHPSASATDTRANIPAMLEVASDYITNNGVAQADVWIASDLRATDWNEDDGRWAAVRERFAAQPGVRFHLLSYPGLANGNLAITVNKVRRRVIGEEAELSLELTITGKTELPGSPISIEFLVDGARSVLEVELKDKSSSIEHTVPISMEKQHGWGKVTLPADRNLADNEFHFVFGPEPARLTTIISDDEATTRPIKLAAMAGPDPTLDFQVVTLSTSQVSDIDWNATSVLIWHANLPTGTSATQCEAFLKAGKPVICFPPEAPNANQFSGLQWTEWQSIDKSNPVGIGYWDNETDLLARTESGDALPVGKQKTQRYCGMAEAGRALARFTNDAPLLIKASPDQPLYACTTLPNDDFSSLARDGVVLYAMIQRAIDRGVSQQGGARNAETGSIEELSLNTLLSDKSDSVSSADLIYHAGSHQTDASWLSINRPPAEDAVQTLEEASIAKLFAGLEYQQIQDEVGSESSLANEIWRLFLFAMAIALVFEAILCLG